MNSHDRRRFLQGALATGGALLTSRMVSAAERVRLADDPFTLGIASGYPGPDSVVLWTRLAPTPLAPLGGMTEPIVAVGYELATDERFRKIVREGQAYASADWGYSVHVELADLAPARDYWYRFVAGGQRSPVGHTRTAPARGASLDRLRVAVASCQQYEHGYYAAYRHMLDDDLDCIVHLGDYIYELSWGNTRVRSHGTPETYTLDDYRVRYALYRSDPDLRAAHAAYPWLATWDDHEVDNDYAGDISEENDDPELFRMRRAAAYQAYYEHMPLPRRAVPFGSRARLYARAAFGDLASVFLLDQRQYRSPLACPAPGTRAAGRVSGCAELGDATRTMLGERQEAWLLARLTDPGTRWNLMAQGTLMSHIDEQPGEGRRYWTDSWNGYPMARQRLLDGIAARNTPNPVMLAGDIHAFLVGRINARPENLESPPLATEFVTTSISSEGRPQVAEFVRENPNLAFASGEHRGYLRLTVEREQLTADLVALESALRPDSGRRVLQTYTVQNGRPGPV